MEYEYFRPQKPKLPETGIGTLLRNVVSSGANAVSSIAHLATVPEAIYKHAENARNQGLRHAIESGNLSGTDPEVAKAGLQQLEQNPYQPKLAQVVEQASEGVKSLFPEQYLEPQSETEEVVQDYASMIPLYLIGGGSIKSIPSFIGKTFAGRKVGEQVKNAGGGEFGRLAAEIGVPALLTALSPSNISKEFKTIQQKDYNEILPALGKDQFVDAQPFVKALEETAIKSKRVAGANRHLSNINDWFQEVKDGKLPLDKLQPLKAQINELAYDTNNRVYKPLANALRKMGKDTINTHPEYGHALKRADKITELYSQAESTADFVKNSLKSIPVTKKYAVKKAINLLWDNPISSSAKIVGSLTANLPKETAEYALKMFDAATKQQLPNFIKYAGNFGKLIEKAEKMPSEEFEYYRK